MTTPKPKVTTKYLLGLDLGQAQDYTALSIVERILTEIPPADAVQGAALWTIAYNVRHLERFVLGTLYTSVADRVKELCGKEPVKGNLELVVDATGVGRGVIELLRERLKGITRPMPVTITGGNKATDDDEGGYHVPKRDLVGVVQTLLQTESLKVARELAEAQTLVKELQNFKVKITANANDTYEAWREGDHDDTVLATALACWWGENRMPKSIAPPLTYNKAYADAINTLAMDR